jgi:hypothetical protein
LIVWVNKSRLFEEMSTTKPTLTLGCLGTYLASFWVLLGINKIPVEIRFHEALCQAFKELRAELEKEWRLTSLLIQHQIHGNSGEIEKMLSGIIIRGLAHYRTPDYADMHFSFDKSMAESLLKDISSPEQRDILRRLAERTIEIMRSS